MAQNNFREILGELELIAFERKEISLKELKQLFLKHGTFFPRTHKYYIENLVLMEKIKLRNKDVFVFINNGKK